VMKPTMLYHCARCSDFVETTEHDVLELYEDGTRQVKFELRCSLCTREVIEAFGCVTCKVAEAEPGADECTHCLSVSEKPVSNSTPAYLRSHAIIEHEPEYQEKAA
jgi:hypothetical protein